MVPLVARSTPADRVGVAGLAWPKRCSVHGDGPPSVERLCPCSVLLFSMMFECRTLPVLHLRGPRVIRIFDFLEGISAHRGGI